MATTIKQLITAGRPVPHEVGKPIVELAGVSVHYDGLVALDNISFRLVSGGQIAVVGPNGAGKSTLFKVIAGVLPLTAGEVNIFGHGPGGHICIAYLPQRSQVDWSFPVTVADVVMMGRIGKLGFLHWPRAHDWAYVRQCLDVVGMTDLADRQIDQLSGGQQQRMFIAQALAQEAELMLMDEPLAGLDVTSQEDIFRILNSLRQQAVTILVALHDLKLAAERFDQVMLLNRRLLGLGNPRDIFEPDRLTRAYGEHLRMIQTPDGMLMFDDTCCDDGDVHDGQRA